VPFEAIMEALKELDRMDAEFGRTFGQAPAASEPQHLDA
jgi:hypothetical protein